VTAALDAPLCDGGRCSQIMTLVGQWRGERETQIAAAAGAAAGHLMQAVVSAAVEDAELPAEAGRRLLGALDGRLQRVAAGDVAWLGTDVVKALGLTGS
jgi:hypothetical protein